MDWKKIFANHISKKWLLLQMVTAAMKLKDSCYLEEKLQPTYTAY